MKDAFTEETLLEIAAKEVMHLPEQEREDAAQEFMLGALTAAARAKEGGAVRTLQWTYGRGYVRHFVNRSMRVRGHEQDTLNRVVLDNGKGVLHLYDVIIDPRAEQPETDLSESEARERLVEAMAHLTPTQREIVERRYLQGERAETVAGALKCSAKNIYGVEQRAMETLRAYLTGRKAS